MGPAIEQDPGRLQRVGVADQRRHLLRVLASVFAGDLEDAASHGGDRLVPGQQAAAGLVHQPEGPPEGHLPGRHALQIAAELRLPEPGLLDQRHPLRELLLDQLRGLPRPLERAVHDARQAGVAQPPAEELGLLAAARAEREVVEMAVEDLLGVEHVGMPDQVDACQRHESRV